MLCHLCEPFLTDLVNEDFANWRHVDRGWYTYKHANYATVKATAAVGCDICALFDRVRAVRIPGYEGLSEKWLVQASSIDYKYEFDRQVASNAHPLEKRTKWTFHLLTVLPEMSWIAFELFRPTSTSAGHAGEPMHPDLPREVRLSADSTDSAIIASTWLRECQNVHSHCVLKSDTTLPTRVLEIQQSADSYKLQLRVTRGRQGAYVTLSHCWGSRERLTLETENLEELQHCIAFEDLPPTFQDAVRLTAALGQRYLWIDALCIIQNDGEDWAREAASMCAIYENALFSISALVAEDSHSGILQHRTAAQVLVDVAGVSIGIRERLSSLSEALSRSKLESRAWCLQERLLAPRILHVAADQLHWECRTHILSETCPSHALRNDSGEASRPFTATGMGPVGLEKENDDHHAHWLYLIAGYSARELSKASDRLPAISGLAEKAQRELDLGSYAYGLWLDYFPAGLLWRRRCVRRRANFCIAAENAHVPSWSWASSERPVEYPLLDQGLESPPSGSDVIMKDQHIEDARGDGAANVSLYLLGRIKRGTCKRSTNTSNPYEAIFKGSGSLLTDEGLPCTLDKDEEFVSRGCYCLFIHHLSEAARSKVESLTKHTACYLILERIQARDAGPDTTRDSFGSFRRIGMGLSPADRVDKVFANTERQRLELA